MGSLSCAGCTPPTRRTPPAPSKTLVLGVSRTRPCFDGPRAPAVTSKKTGTGKLGDDGGATPCPSSVASLTRVLRNC